MEDFDMSRPGTELFPEMQSNNSYQGVNEQVAEAQPYQSGVQEADVAGQQELSNKEINFRAMREELAKMQSEREYWRGQAEARNALNMPQEREPFNPLKDVEEDGYASGRNVKQAYEALKKDHEQLRAEFKDQIRAIETKTQHSDWNNMVTQHVPQLTSKNPIFAEMIQNASNPYEAAYLLAELNAKASTPKQTVNPDAQRAIANSQKPQSVSTIGGHGSLSNADYYASLSDEDFMRVAAKNMASI